MLPLPKNQFLHLIQEPLLLLLLFEPAPLTNQLFDLVPDSNLSYHFSFIDIYFSDTVSFLDIYRIKLACRTIINYKSIYNYFNFEPTRTK